MPHQNRIDPFGRLIETRARGLLMGNRGCLHDAEGRLTRRRWTTKAWIACRLDFKGRWRPIMPPGRYTTLFFLDEATALAAGHRPCGECRRADLTVFKLAWRRGNPARAEGDRILVEPIDAVIHRERIQRAPWMDTPLPAVDLADLPDGAMVTGLGDPAVQLIWGDRLWRWSLSGYTDPRSRPTAARVRLVTPPSVVRALAAGYRPSLHPTQAG